LRSKWGKDRKGKIVVYLVTKAFLCFSVELFTRLFLFTHILSWMADPRKRKRTRKGLLKVEQIHQLARDITYGNRGRFKGKSLEDINSSGNCTTLIMAAIIYWQAKEISRIVKEQNPEAAGIDLSLLAHISPIEWSNVILYGEYKLNRDLVRR
jgi:hypothetical protein